MNEKPIPFNAEMVRAVLEGRKTQTRRVVTVPWGERSKTVPYSPYFEEEDGRLFFLDEYGDCHDFEKKWKCPYGEKDQELWVREAYRLLSDFDRCKPSEVAPVALVKYEANNELNYESPLYSATDGRWGRYRNSRFMPRWASRIQLLVKNIRVERVQDISEEDCIKEGIINNGRCYQNGDGHAYSTAKDAFRNLWNSINEKRGSGWDKNPWVWVVEFEAI